MTSTLAGQLILGTDKRNPLLSVYEREKGQGQELHVYYGLELLEVVPQTLWCDHLGIPLFAPVLIAVAQVVKPTQALFKHSLLSPGVLGSALAQG